MNCVICGEEIQEDERHVSDALIVNGSSAYRGGMHDECIALRTVGHDHGVCTCTGYDTSSRTAALELWRRMGEKRIR